MKNSIILLDCTLRDGGYYNEWDFSPKLVNAYLKAMQTALIDVIEIGFRFIRNDGYKGPYAYSKDSFIRNLDIPENMKISVMVNGSDLLTDIGFEKSLEILFPETAETSRVDIVRLACHFHEYKNVLPAVEWLCERGYRVGFNIMQIADRTKEEILEFARKAKMHEIDVLYFADSMGSMTPDDTARVINWMRQEWIKPIGVHTHNNMGLALQNTLRSVSEGATWLDCTVTGMGRGPGNAMTEELVIEADNFRNVKANLIPLLSLIDQHFSPMKDHYGWGTNPYYFLSGKYGIHPTYIQQMIGDPRYTEEDIIAVIEYLKESGGKKFSFDTLQGARNFYKGPSKGTWSPAEMMKGRDVLILGAGLGAAKDQEALKSFILNATPLVIALNTQSPIEEDFINLRVACHPVRLLADCERHKALPQPLITPASMLPEDVCNTLFGKELLDFGISIEPDTFSIEDKYCTTPNPLALAYALAVVSAGHVKTVYLAGFDGYPPGDNRNSEVEAVLKALNSVNGAPEVVAITKTRYKHLTQKSVHGSLS